MLPSLDEIAGNFRLADALDLAVATVLFALVFHWMRKRSNHALLLVLFGILGLYAASHGLRMYLTLGLFRVGLSLALIGVLIVFQKDLRYGFERLAAWHPFSRRAGEPPNAEVLSTLVEAAALFAREKIGALIVLPARQNLERDLGGGERLEGRLSVSLLHSIFHPKSPGHDGAVVIRGDRVESFGVHLPLSTNFSAVGSGGTRHAAALGLAELSDALVIVVSEERGAVSVAHQGRLQTFEQSDELADKLKAFSDRGTDEPTVARWVRLLPARLWAVSLGFVAACLFWLIFAFQVDSVQRVVDQVPVELHGLPEDWVVESVAPEQIRLHFTGSERAVSAFDWKSLRVVLELGDPVNGLQTAIVKEETIGLPEEISLVRAEPSLVRITAYRTQTVQLPVKVRTYGELPPEWALASQTTSPQSVTVKVRESLVSSIQSIPTESLDLSEAVDLPTREIPLDFPDGVWPASDAPSSVQVRFEIRKLEPE